jgi:hypothetical protein
MTEDDIRRIVREELAKLLADPPPELAAHLARPTQRGKPVRLNQSSINTDGRKIRV